MLCLVLLGAFCFAHSEEGKLGKGDEITIDSIRVYQLKTDCDSDVLITDMQDLTDYQPSVKKAISIVPAPEFTVPSNTIINMRAAESIIMEKGFAITQGTQMTFQTQICPN